MKAFVIVGGLGLAAMTLRIVVPEARYVATGQREVTRIGAPNAPTPPTPPITWTTLDLYDFTVALPGTPVESTTDEAPGGMKAKVHAHLVTRRPENFFQARVIDFVNPPQNWNARGSADGAAHGALEGIRRTEGVVAVDTWEDQEVTVAGMPGRSVSAVASSGTKRLFARYTMFSRFGRLYEVSTVTDSEDNDVVARQVFASIKETPRALEAQRTEEARRRTATDAELESVMRAANAFDTGAANAYGGSAVETSPTLDYHGPVHVRGYTRNDGTYVPPHTRSR